MTKENLTKADYTALLIKGSLENYVSSNKLVKPGERFTFTDLFHLTRQDVVDYFAKHGFPPFDATRAASPPFNGDYETVWTYENWEYTALWLEKGTSSNLYSTHTKEEFQAWWNEQLLKEYEFKLTYPHRI